MLETKYKDLYQKISDFRLDDPNAVITFSRKLSEKQNWSLAYTARVIDEYRKFMFLCCVAPRGASPPKAVDEAWHLHLTYTVSYWKDLCREGRKRWLQ